MDGFQYKHQNFRWVNFRLEKSLDALEEYHREKRRAEIDEDSLSGDIDLGEKAEQVLGTKLLQFAEVVEVVAREGYPNLLCNYLYELADSFMKFYESCPVLSADEPLRSSRLQVALLTARTIQQGLNLLGIETVERM